MLRRSLGLLWLKSTVGQTPAPAPETESGPMKASPREYCQEIPLGCSPQADRSELQEIDRNGDSSV